MFIFQTYLVVWSVWHFCFLLIKLWKYCLLQIDQIITVESAQREQQHPLPIAHLASIFYYEITVHEFASLHLCHSHQLGIATSIEWSNDWLIEWGWSRWDQKDGISVLSLQSLGECKSWIQKSSIILTRSFPTLIWHFFVLLKSYSEPPYFAPFDPSHFSNRKTFSMGFEVGGWPIWIIPSM